MRHFASRARPAWPATSRPAWISGARGPPAWPRWIARWRWPSSSPSAIPTRRTSSPASAIDAAAGRIARAGSSRATRSRSSAGPCRSPTSTTLLAADTGTGPDLAADDPEVAADLAAARAAGTLADDAAEAWGNAAIAGFGIGRPVAAPELEPGVNALPIASADEAARTTRTFSIASDDLVLAASDEVPSPDRPWRPGRRGPSVHRRSSSSACSARRWPSCRRWSRHDVSGGFGR